MLMQYPSHKTNPTTLAFFLTKYGRQSINCYLSVGFNARAKGDQKPHLGS